MSSLIFFCFTAQVIKKVNEIVEEQLLQQQIYEKEQEKLKIKQQKEDDACGETSPRT